jgi:hypothetical protein
LRTKGGTVSGALEEVRGGLASRVRRVEAMIRRAAPGPLLVRAGIFVTAVAAIVTAYPASVLHSRSALMLVALAAVPAVAPRGQWPTAVALATVAGWLLSTIGYGDPVTLWRLVALAAMLYLSHSLAALAAVLPYDAVVSPDALARWLLRASAVVAASALLALVALVGAAALGGRALLVASLLGVAVAVGVAALLAWLFRRD